MRNFNSTCGNSVIQDISHFTFLNLRIFLASATWPMDMNSFTYICVICFFQSWVAKRAHWLKFKVIYRLLHALSVSISFYDITLLSPAWQKPKNKTKKLQQNQPWNLELGFSLFLPGRKLCGSILKLSFNRERDMRKVITKGSSWGLSKS